MTVCFTTDRTLHFGDCDISGTAYYPAYLNILNGVIEEFWNPSTRQVELRSDDEILRGCLLTRDGRICHALFQPQPPSPSS